MFTNKNVLLLLRHERIYEYHNDVFKLLKLENDIFMKTMFINAEK
jgi:hypothetical protein